MQHNDAFFLHQYDSDTPPDISLMRTMLERMLLTRRFEEKIAWLFAKGLAHGTAHLGIGEEATGVGSGLALKDEDYMLATHRGHGQAIGKGCDVYLMMAEIFGKEAGLCHGRGGSMHISDIDKGVLGANGILGANAPLACGAALTCKQKGLDRVCATFLGDGASNQGAVHEAMNLAAAWKLPVLFLLVNNTYAMSTPLHRAVNDTDLTKRGIPYGIPACEVDGNDVIAVYRAVTRARAYAIEHGPVLVVERTYRISGHSKSDKNVYRSEEEIALWRARCPIDRLRSYLLDNGIFTQFELDAMDANATAAIEKAYTFAQACPDPDECSAMRGTYVE